jgi:hypothetical protein
VNLGLGSLVDGSSTRQPLVTPLQGFVNWHHDRRATSKLFGAVNGRRNALVE